VYAQAVAIMLPAAPLNIQNFCTNAAAEGFVLPGLQ
jgi:hypothetical protein